MAQLTDDCFAFGGPLLSVDDVGRLIRERVTPVPQTEAIPVSAARGRVLAQDTTASVALPPFDNSAVDGYAVRHQDLQTNAETRLKVRSRLLAGHGATAPIEPGTATRIFTGAPMPTGADTVFMQEDCKVDGDDVLLPAGLKPGANRRLKGEDVREGAVVLRAGVRLAPQHLAMASAVGTTMLTVRRRIRVALFSTGDEIVEAGSPLPPAAVYDANRTLLRGQAEALGADVSDLGILADEPETLARALGKAAASHDLVLTSGGVSTGEADYVRTAVEAMGALTFWRTAIKPGRPVAMGVLRAPNGEACAFCGLPGNPVAAFVTFVRIVRPLLLQLSGAHFEDSIALPVRATFAYKKKEGRREYVRVSLSRAQDGVMEATKYAQDGAGVISSLTSTDGLVELPEDSKGVKPGDSINFISYAALIGG
ncbi:MAG: molybdopterin molybdotransferase MoeA [Hyphomicrobiaceae bacterium]|nr:molybdopterin molybdotransferase MoeA [Hyphomicrobiaceae bacterium]